MYTNKWRNMYERRQHHHEHEHCGGESICCPSKSVRITCVSRFNIIMKGNTFWSGCVHWSPCIFIFLLFCCWSWSLLLLLQQHSFEFSLMVGTDSISKSVISTSCSFMYCIALFVLSARGKKKKTNQFNIFDHCTEMVDDTFRTNTSCIARSHELVLDWVLFCANITQIAIYPNGRNNASVEICDAITNQRKDRSVKCWFKWKTFILFVCLCTPSN